MRIHTLQHVFFEGLGSIEQWIHARGHQSTVTRLYRHEPLPSVSDFDWLIVMGGPMSVDEDHQYPWLLEEKRFIAEAIARGKWVLGICLGAQLIAHVLGARVFRNRHSEIGWFPVERTSPSNDCPILKTLPAVFTPFHWHGDTFDLPQGALHMAKSSGCDNQAFVYSDHVFAFQFHLETTLARAKELIKHWPADLVEGPYIEHPRTFLAKTQRFAEISAQMQSIMTQLEIRLASRLKLPDPVRLSPLISS